MPFNSNTYYLNKWRNDAHKELAKARQLKADGPDPIRERYTPGYHAADIVFHVRMARSHWRLYLSQRIICALDRRSAVS